MADGRPMVDRIASAIGWEGAVSARLSWDEVEARMKTSFPRDYKEFMGKFPSGAFRDVIRILNPIQDGKFLALFEEDFDRSLVGVKMAREYGYDSFPPFPEPGGVIPFASDFAGGTLFWLPWTPDPDKWHVVYQSRHSPDDWTRTKRPMTAVMLELATSRSTRNILGWDMAAKDRSLEPFELGS
ncbi:SMI1/KNR4 family protein [Amycolatopsis orientalis]|uniref:SMI1/KNR4 family protein n=1 Tax=Amycolatopsis orientalis TaxID=31958 RepID=UPI0009DF3610|nr:SMI1/KNR4 family protein [Amycolatopsis orientalis]